MSREENLEFKNRNLIYIENQNEFIYRIYPIDRLLQVFNETKNTLVKPRLWDDPFENFLLKSTARNTQGHKIHFDSLREKIYGQCWTFNQNETDALWRIYSPQKNGVRVKTTVKKLFDSFFNPDDEFSLIKYFMGKVNYFPEADIRSAFESDSLEGQGLFDTSSKGIINTLLIKRIEFEHENEVRILYMSQKSDNEDSVYKYEFNATDIFDEILFDPRMEDNLFDMYVSILKRMGYNKTIEHSTLYKFNTLNLRLDV